MWRSKKFVIIAVLTAVALVGSISGVVLAQTGNTDTTQGKALLAGSANTTSGKTLMARVAAILGIDQQKVEDAFAQAQREMRDEALDSYLQKLVDEGKITKEQADQYKQWWQARPDMPVQPGMRGHGWFRGMGCFRGCWPGPASPTTTPTTQSSY